MKILNLKALLLLLMAAFAFASCDETDEAGEFDNWEKRNIAFIDSIATVARTNASGEWKKFLAYGLVDTVKWSNEYYVYCQVLERGDGTTMPHYNDTVMVNYRGRLIPTKSYPNGFVFDQSYRGELDPEVNVPAVLNLAGCVRGWTTAMTEMVKGDVWRVYIPYELGYGESAYSAVPAYSTLIFDLNLVDFDQVGSNRE